MYLAVYVLFKSFRHTSDCPHIRYTPAFIPKPSPTPPTPLTAAPPPGAPLTTPKANPSTSLVSVGLMIPSSHRRAVAYRAVDCSSI